MKNATFLQRIVRPSFVALFVALMFAIGTASAATITVTTGADETGLPANGDCSLREAIQNFNDFAAGNGVDVNPDCTADPATVYGLGDLIVFDPAVTSSTITLAGQDDLNEVGDFDIMTSLTIDGGAAGVVIDADGQTGNVSTRYNRAFHIMPTNGVTPVVTLQSLEIVNGGGEGFGHGGAIKNDGGVLTIVNSSLHDNSALTTDSDGGALWNGEGGEVTLVNSDVYNNSAADGFGGGIFNNEPGAKLTLDGSSVMGNSAENANGNGGSGGGIFNYSGHLVLMNGSEVGMSGSPNVAAYGNGGGIFNALDVALGGGTDDGRLYISNSNVTYNEAWNPLGSYDPANYGSGAGIANTGTVLVDHAEDINYNPALPASSISYNIAQNDGGGVLNLGENAILSVYDATIEGNDAGASLNGVALGGNGGGVANIDGLEVQLVNVSLLGNDAEAGVIGGVEVGYGGGLYTFNDPATAHSAIINIDGVEAAGNYAGRHGGAIFNSGDNLTVKLNSLLEDNESEYNGGAIWNGDLGQLAVLDSILDANFTNDGDGGAIYNDGAGAKVVVSGSQVSENIAGSATGLGGSGGGIYNNGGELVLNNASVIEGNQATFGNGGGVYNHFDVSTALSENDGHFYMSNSSILSNEALNPNGGADPLYGNGGGIANTGTVLIDSDLNEGYDANLAPSVIALNSSHNNGGGYWGSGEVSLLQGYAGVMFEENTAGVFQGDSNAGANGGAIFNNKGGVFLVDVEILGNVALSQLAPPAALGLGGGIYNATGSVTGLHNVVMENNAADLNGGAVWSGLAELVVENSTVNANSAASYGGGLYSTGTATVLNSVITANTASHVGGGLFFSGQALIDSTTVGGNTSGNAGGMYNIGAVIVANSTFHDNEADGHGGAVYNIDGAELTVQNSTFSANVADVDGVDGGDGGAIYNAQGVQNNLPSVLHIDSATLAFNSTGIHNDETSTVELHNTILDNFGANCTGVGNITTSTGFNMENGMDCVLNGPEDVQETDPMLDPALALNSGGVTMTHLLLVGSTAIDTGSTELGTDQNGALRPEGVADDRGAVESSVVIPPPDDEPGDEPGDDPNRGGGSNGGGGGSSGGGGGSGFPGFPGGSTPTTSDSDPGVELAADDECSDNYFRDYETLVANWLRCEGIAHGYADNNSFYSPDDLVQYSHFAKLLARSSEVVTTPHVMGSDVNEYVYALIDAGILTDADLAKVDENVTVEDATLMTEQLTDAVVDFGEGVNGFLERNKAASTLYDLFAN